MTKPQEIKTALESFVDNITINESWEGISLEIIKDHKKYVIFCKDECLHINFEDGDTSKLCFTSRDVTFTSLTILQSIYNYELFEVQI